MEWAYPSGVSEKTACLIISLLVCLTTQSEEQQVELCSAQKHLQPRDTFRRNNDTRAKKSEATGACS